MGQDVFPIAISRFSSKSPIFYSIMEDVTFKEGETTENGKVTEKKFTLLPVSLKSAPVLTL